MTFSFTLFACVSLIITADVNVVNSKNATKTNRTKRSYENYTTYESFGAYRSLEPLMKVLNEHSEEPHVKELLRLYRNVCPQPFTKIQTERKRALIAVEGLLTGSMNKVPELLAKSLDARYVTMPPDCLRKIQDKFRGGANCSNEFTALCRYAASNAVSHFLRNRPVVIQKYWHDMTSFAIAKAHTLAKLPLPPQNSSLYSFPDDLEKPRRVFYVTMSTTRDEHFDSKDENESKTSNKTNTFLSLQQTINSNFYDPEVTRIEYETKSWATCLHKMHISILKDFSINATALLEGRVAI